MTMMTIHEIEELDFNPRSEAQNCLTEAEDFVRNASRDAEHFGTGDFLIVAQWPHYCRATDAFAGMITVEVHHHATAEEAERTLGRLAALPFYYDTEAHLERRFPAAPAPAPALAVDDFDIF